MIASGKRLLLPEKHSRYMYIKDLSPPRPVAVELIPSQRSVLRNIQKELLLFKNDLMSKNSYSSLTSSYSTTPSFLFCRHMLAGTSRDLVSCNVTILTMT